jgi:hypothetical protein
MALVKEDMAPEFPFFNTLIYENFSLKKDLVFERPKWYT